MKSELAPIVRDSQRLLREVIRTASKMPKDFKGILGAKLRDDCLNSSILVQSAFRVGSRPMEALPMLEEVVRLNDGVQLLLQVGYEVQAIQSSGRLTELSTIASAVGRQCGGWLKAVKSKHPNGQIPAPSAPSESAGTLSTHGASAGAQR